MRNSKACIGFPSLCAAYRCRDGAARTAECFLTRSASSAGRSRDSLPATRIVYAARSGMSCSTRSRITSGYLKGRCASITYSSEVCRQTRLCRVNCRIFVNVLYPNMFNGIPACVPIIRAICGMPCTPVGSESSRSKPRCVRDDSSDETARLSQTSGVRTASAGQCDHAVFPARGVAPAPI